MRTQLPILSTLSMLFLGILSTGTIHAQNDGIKVKEYTVNSPILHQEVNILVRLPESYNGSKSKYTVLYLLHENDATVEEIAAISQKMHQDNGTPEMIVVGVNSSGEKLDRMRDHTKYDQFLSYMEQELIPAIGKSYRTNKSRLLYEKSLSGSFALYAFLTKPTLFNGYIAASKQWYEDNNDYFTGLAKTALQHPTPFKGRKIFLATLNGAYNNNNIPEVNKQMQAFTALLKSKSGNKILAEYEAFDDWGITPQPGFNEGLLFVAEKGEKTPKAPLTMTQTSNGEWVVMDGKKTTLYEVFLYDNGPDYPSEGLIRVIKNGKIGYADANTYTIVIEPQFDCAFPFEDGKAKVSNHCKTSKEGEHSIWTSDAWQYVDKKGNVRNN